MLHHFFVIANLIVGTVKAAATVNQYGLGDVLMDGDIEPHFILWDQHNVKTRCGKPPAIIDGNYTLVEASLGGNVGNRAHLVSYTCNPGYHLLGQPTLICDHQSGKWSGEKPTCETGLALATPSVDCSSQPPPAEVIICFPKVVVRYRFSTQSGKCERYLACARNTFGFATEQECKQKCANSSTLPMPNPTEEQEMGPQCLPGAPITHSSCLGDSPYLVHILPINVTEILAEHNLLRSEVKPPADPPIQPFTWDYELAMTAERWAAQCRFDNDKAGSRRIPSQPFWPWIGQNLCTAECPKTTAIDCIQEWGQESNNWTYGIGPVPSNTTVGDYTQMVNAKTSHIGCGLAHCNKSQGDFTVFVCNYAPGGNVGRQNRNPYAFPYPVGNSSVVPALAMAVPATVAPTIAPASSHESGGLRGAHCLPGVDSSHTSCLQDCPNLVNTTRFNFIEIVDAHNKIRSSVFPPATVMPKLAWSEELAITAERWAAQCRFANDLADGRKLLQQQWPWVGQNIQFSTIDLSWQDLIIHQWAKQAANYRYGVGPVPANATVGTYTQIVWSQTTHVGCGKAICRNLLWNFVFVCNYGPGGNVGQTPFKFPYPSDGHTAMEYDVLFGRRRRPSYDYNNDYYDGDNYDYGGWFRRTTTPRYRRTTTSRYNRRTTTTPYRPPPRSTTEPAPRPGRITTQPSYIPTTAPSESGGGSSTGKTSGGLRGPQCFPSVPKSHSSCLSDSSNLVKTFSFSVDEVLNRHDSYRQNVQPPAESMPMLQYSEELAIMAERWAAQCPSGHNEDDTRATSEWDWVGQNICWSSGYEQSWTDCIDGWGSEKEDWQYGVGAVPSGAMIGHYTQIIWADTLFVGCGKAQCRNTKWEYTLVCNYGPGGNIGNGFQEPYAKPYQAA